MSTSLIEKYLLKRGMTLRDRWDPRQNKIMTLAVDEETGRCLAYPKSTFAYKDQDRAGLVARLLAELGDLEGLTAREAEARVFEEALRPPEGFSCQRCGRCCRLGDSCLGLVSVDEVEKWQALGLSQILKLVVRVERPDYLLYVAWKNPKTGRFLPRCPWFRKERGEDRGRCLIHDYSPLKCRAFPFSREQAERAGCPGFE
ncbi:MAG: YkgJ family cysteine cluster protein [Thermodesulfobacteriota bacterium]